MTTRERSTAPAWRTPLTWAKRLLLVMVAMASLLGVSAVAGPVANAAVYPSCTVGGCPAAYRAGVDWGNLGYPSRRDWYIWPPTGQCNFAGGQYYNRNGQLPAGHVYFEYDVNPRACNAPRDAYRIVYDETIGVIYFSPNHYTDFYRL